MKMFKRIGSTIIATVMALMCFTACGSSEYDSYYEDIVGIWYNAEGVEYYTDEDEEDIYFVYYEFTSDKQQYTHNLSYNSNSNQIVDYSSTGIDFVIQKNYYIVGNKRAMIYIEGDTLTMINDSSTTYYTRLTVEEATKNSLYYNDTELRAQQNVLLAEGILNDNEEETEATEEASEEE